jgi:hypothetical protein
LLIDAPLFFSTTASHILRTVFLHCSCFLLF